MRPLPGNPSLRWLGLIALGAAGLWALRSGVGSEAPTFVTAPVSRGDIVRPVIATGAVNPVATVQVGTYVSGVIQELRCDYNTRVQAGQVCATIDPRPYQVVVDQSIANLASARAQLRKDQAALAFARIVLTRDKGLVGRGGVSQETVDTDNNNFEQAAAQVALDEATIAQRQAALDAARVNLDYTSILSPVDGIVVSRSIDVGQTVAASFQTPTLFLIAKDLTNMQVDTNVSESDIGETKVGQRASFTVEAWPDRVFRGQVTQIRQAPITVQNVVTYDVVVGVDNSELLLLPGMTANIRIVVDERHDVLRVPQQALRFVPKDSAAADSKGKGQGETEKRRGGEGKAVEGRVWVLRDGRPQAVSVTTGLGDGSLVEIVQGPLQAEDAVIVNEIRADEKKGGPAAPPRPVMRF